MSAAYPPVSEAGYCTHSAVTHAGSAVTNGRKRMSVPSRPGRRTSVVVFTSPSQIVLAARFTVNARSAALNRNDTMPCAVAVRRITLLVMPTSETCDVMPMTNEK